jgi:hypothetical protein
LDCVKGCDNIPGSFGFSFHHAPVKSPQAGGALAASTVRHAKVRSFMAIGEC